MLNFDDNHARKIWVYPILVKFVGIFFDDSIVALNIESLAVNWRQVRVRRSLAETAESIGEMAMKDDKGIAGFRMLFKAPGQKNMGAKIDWPSPEIAEQFALDFDMLDVFCLWRIRDRRDFFVKENPDRFFFPWVDLNQARSAVHISRRKVPALTFTAIHGKLDCIAIRAVKSLIAVKKSLNPVFAGWKLSDAF